MKLSREQRQAILDGKPPRALTFKRSSCPKPLAGTVLKIEDRVAVTLTTVSFTREHWICEYRLRDDRPRLLRAGAPKGIEGRSKHQLRRHWIPDEEHGYTPNPSQALHDAGEAVEPQVQARFSEQAKLEGYQRDELAQARRTRYDLLKRLERVREEARRRGVDVSSPERVIERQIAKMERRVHQGKAA